MSCSCNCSPCNCQPRPSVCCTPTVESVEYTFENANLVGIGVFDNDTDNLVQFRGIVSNSAALTVTLDATDNTIVFDFDQAALVADIPDADTTTRGILETATNAEAIAKAATNKILVPSNLAALGSSDTFAGLVELATNAETQAGVSTTLAVTPAGLASTIVLSNTATWADAVARAAKVPAFQGQFGAQLDLNLPYLASGTAAGDFNIQLFGFGLYNAVSGALATTVDLVGGSTLVLASSDTTGFLYISVPTEITSSSVNMKGLFNVTTGGVVDFTGTGQIYVGGVLLNNESLLGGDNAGIPTAYQINQFLSSHNVQTGWGTPSSTLARTTFATYAGQAISNPPTQAEVQAMDDALVIVSQRLGALITDLKAIQLPAT